MGYSKTKIEAQKTSVRPMGVKTASEVMSLIVGIPTPKIVDGKIEDVQQFIKSTIEVIREHLLTRYGLGSKVHELAVMRLVNAIQTWFIARDALEKDGHFFTTESGALHAHPAHRMIAQAEKVMLQFELDFGLLPRQSFSRAEASSAGGVESKESSAWLVNAGNLMQGFSQ